MDGHNVLSYPIENKDNPYGRHRAILKSIYRQEETVKRGPYSTKHVSRNRRVYDLAYYYKNKRRILAQHRLRHMIKKHTQEAKHGD